MTGKRFKLLINIVTFIVLGLVLYAIRHDLTSVVSNLRESKMYLLLLIIPLQAVWTHAYTRMYQELFKTLKESVAYWPMMRVSFELNFVNYILPTNGLSGFGYFAARMKSFGVPGARSTLSQTLKIGIQLGSFVPVIGFGVLLLAFNSQVSNPVLIAASGMSFGILLIILFFIFLLDKKHRLQNTISYILKKTENFVSFFKKNPVTLLTKKREDRIDSAMGKVESEFQLLKSKWRELIYTSRWGVLATLMEVATIGVCFAALGGGWPSWGIIIVAYGVANLASFIAVMPGGHGIYEAAMTGVLVSGGLPAGLSLTAVLAYRVISLALYMPTGYYLYSRYIAQSSIGEFLDNDSSNKRKPTD